MAEPTPDYFRGDQASGITAPDLSKLDCTYAEHIVHARGKRTKYTSVSLDPARIKGFGDVIYRLVREKLSNDGHHLVEHAHLLAELRRTVAESERAERSRAIQAIRYVQRRIEGLVEWRFDVSGVERKDIMTWAYKQVQAYFNKV